METDLFLALLDKANPRGHPLLTALLYTYCPAAARWWLAGADPVNPVAPRATPPSPGAPFDPTWQALADLAGGDTLKEALSRHGFETLLDDARQYVAQVDAWRDRHPGIPAPERLPTFTGGRLPLSRRFDLQEAVDQFGKRWENFFVYVRAWAFVVRDWEREMRFVSPPERAPARLALTLPGVRRPVFLPAWSWGNVVGEGTRLVVSLLVSGRERDQVRLGLARRAGPAGEKPWVVPPEVWVLDRVSGAAEPADIRLDDEALPEVVGRLADLAQNGPHPPLAALQGASQCLRCGFRAQCFLENGELSPLALTIQ